MVAMPPVPNPNNFLFLLEMSIKQGKPFAYRISQVATKNFYINLEIAKVIAEVLNKLDGQNRINILSNVPENMTTLTMKCLETYNSKT